MSAEVENGEKEEREETKEPKKSLKQRIKEKWAVGLKILEIILCIACLCFVYEPARVTGLGKNQIHHVGIMYTAYTGFIMINGALLTGRFLGDRLTYKTATVFSVCGASIFLLTGTLLIADRAHLTKHYFFHPHAYLMEMLTTSIIFAFVNTLVFVFDAIITFRRQEAL